MQLEQVVSDPKDNTILELLVDMLASAARCDRIEQPFTPSAWHEHVPFAHWLVGAARPRSIVELGTHWGTSYFAFCMAVKDWALDTKCHAVDTWHGEPHAGTYGEEVFESISAINDREFSSFSSLVRSTFADAAKRFPNGSIDILHIDGFHTYEAVREDFLTWRAKLSDRGIVLLHDSQERITDFGVWRLVAELAAEYSVFEFIHGHGLAIVAIGNQLPAPLQTLLGLGPDSIDAAAVRKLWAMQGRRSSDRMAQGAARSQELANRDQQLVELGQQLSILHDQLARESAGRARAEAHHAAAQAGLVGVQRQHLVLKSRLDAVLSSTSWRSTAWLRTIVDLARGSARGRAKSIRARSTQATTGPLRVLMAGHALDLTGAPHSQFEIAAGLRRRHLADPVILSTADGPLRARYESASIQVQVIEHPLLHVDNLPDYKQRIAELAALLRKMQVAVVHANTLQTFWAVDAAAAAGLPVIWNVRESERWQTYFDWLPPPLRSCAYECFGRAWRIVFVSYATKEAWSPLERGGNFTVIHNGLDLRAFDARLNELDHDRARQRIGVENVDVVIVLVGTVTERKGQLDLIRAAALLPSHVAERCQIYIVGDRPSTYSDQLHCEATKLPICWNNRLHILGETEAVPIYLRAADIFVCSSRIESYPRVTLEAMAASLPIVTTPVFGIAEQVRAGENALLYQPGAEGELADALTRLINDPDHRRRMGERSRTILQELTNYEQMLEQYAALFYEACGTERPKRNAPCAAS